MAHRRRHHDMTDTTTQAPQTQGSASAQTDAVDEQLAARLITQARSEGISLVGPDGLLQRVAKLVLEGALEGELTDHLGYEAGDPAGRNGGNSRNGSRAKTVLTEVGPVELAVPRDRDASFQPQIVGKRQRRLVGVEDLVMSLVAKGLTTGGVLEGLQAWQSRPLDGVYPVIFIDAIQVKIRDGQVCNRPIYVALAVTCDGERDILGLWAGEHGAGEGAKYWLHVLTEIKNRGVADCCIVVCDGLVGLPDAIATVWPQAITQTCVVHLLRNSFRYASRKHWAQIAKDLRPIYTAPTETAAHDALAAFAAPWEARYPAIIRLWEHAWAEFVPFLNFDPEIRTVLATTNATDL